MQRVDSKAKNDNNNNGRMGFKTKKFKLKEEYTTIRNGLQKCVCVCVGRSDDKKKTKNTQAKSGQHPKKRNRNYSHRCIPTNQRSGRPTAKRGNVNDKCHRQYT